MAGVLQEFQARIFYPLAQGQFCPLAVIPPKADACNPTKQITNSARVLEAMCFVTIDACHSQIK